MFFMKVVSIFCGVALLLAFCADATFWFFTWTRGSAALFSTKSGWVFLFFLFWVISFVLGLFITRRLQIFPFVH